MKMMIVDDNRQVREGICNGVDWKSLRITEIRTAENGKVGLEIFRSFLPDIVLLDVIMPEMSGLDFLKKAKEIKPDVRILLISGYSEFEYAVEAMRYGAVGYELKPLRMQNLLSVMTKLIKDIEDTNEKEERHLLHEKVFQEKVLLDILHGIVTSREEIISQLQRRIPFDMYSRILLLCIVPDAEEYEIETLDFEFVEQVINSTIVGKQDCGVFCRENRTFWLYKICSASALEQYNCQQEFCSLLDNLNTTIENTGLTFSGGVSSAHVIKDIASCYREASYAVQVNQMKGSGSCRIYEKEVSDSDIQNIYQRQLNEMDALFGNEMDDDVAEKIGSIFRIADEFLFYERKYYLKITVLIIERIRQFFYKKGIVLDETTKINEMVEKARSGYDCVTLCRNYFFKMQEQYKFVNMNGFSRMIQNVRNYVNTHFAEPLTVEIMAEYVGRSPNYLSHTFKKECGISFSEYVNVTRIHKAKEMILNSDLRIYEIAEAVGYSNCIHFTQVFKKYEGCSPTAIRKTL